MSSALAGVLGLNLLFLAIGLTLVWGIRGFASVVELVDLLGVSFVVGLCAVTLLATLDLILGGGLGVIVIAALMLVAAAIGSGLGLARRRSLPRALGQLPRLSLGTLVAAACAIGSVFFLVALFHLARVTPLQGADSWEFWVPKAKIIYFDGGIDRPVFTALPEPSIPLFVPALLAIDFRFMGSASSPELAVQYWALYAGFVFAAAAILRRLVPAWLAWLFVALTAIIPELDQRVIDAQGDWTLDMLFALSALVCAVWLRTRERWLLGCFAIVFAATLATKPEAMLLAACLGGGVIVSSLRAWRRAWAVLAVAVGAYVVNLPWRLWWESRGLAPDLPGGVAHQLASPLARVWPALELTLRLQFSTQMWLVALPLTLLAAIACLTLPGPTRETAVLYLATFVFLIIGFTWFTWSSDVVSGAESASLLPRLVGSTVLLSTLLAPLLIDPLLRRPDEPRAVAADAPQASAT